MQELLVFMGGNYLHHTKKGNTGGGCMQLANNGRNLQSTITCSDTENLDRERSIHMYFRLNQT